MPPPHSFDGRSEDLTQTMIVPTLDTPIPEGRSAIWCASFQVAWKQFESDVVRGPVRIRDADVAVERLNRSGVSGADLPPDSLFAAAGLVRDGIVGTIRRGMAERFPGVPPPEISAPADAAVAYAYLQSAIRFPIPFFENPSPFTFTDSAGTPTEVRSFGLRPGDHGGYDRLREQVDVLFCDHAGPDGGKVETFAVDLCKDSSPDQIILARIGRSGTLADALVDLRRRIAASPSAGYQRRLGPNDTLLVPEMNWGVDHRFRELEGRDKVLLDGPVAGLYLDTARQVIRFRLDRSGVRLASESTIQYKSSPRDFHFDRPYLIVMQKRGASHPYFVMWVEDAELLSRRGATPVRGKAATD